MRSLGAGITRETVTDLLPAISILSEYELVGQGHPWRRGRIGSHGHRLGHAARDDVARSVRLDRHLVLSRGRQRALEPRMKPCLLQVVEDVLGLVLEPQDAQCGALLDIRERYAHFTRAGDDRV